MSSNNNSDAERVDVYLARHPRIQVQGSTDATRTNGGGGGGAAGNVGAASCGLISGEHVPVLTHQLENLSRRVAKLEGDRAAGYSPIEQRALANPAPLGLWVRWCV